MEQAYKFITADYLMKPYPSIKDSEFTLQDFGRNKPGIAELNPLRFADMNLLRSVTVDFSITFMIRKPS